MKLSEELLVLAGWLENPDNETLIHAEENDECLDKVASALMKASWALKEAAEEISIIEPQEEDTLTPEALDEMAAVATAFAESGDELLKKQASVLDAILMTLASPKNAIMKLKQAEDDRIEQLKKKYRDTKEEQDKMNGVKEAIKDIEQSSVYKQYRSLEGPMSTRYCPDHHGTFVKRVGEQTVQCPLDGKIYNWEEGYTTLQGNKVPPGSVQGQGRMDRDTSYSVFNESDSRAARSGYNS